MVKSAEYGRYDRNMNARPGLRAKRALLFGTAALLTAAAPASAAVVTWDGSESSDWSDGDNWDTAAPPTSADKASLDTVGPSAPVIGAGVSGVSGDVFVGSYAHGAFTIQDGGDLVSSGGIYIGNGFTPLTGAALVTGAGSTWTSAGAAFVGRYGLGELHIENGGQVSNTATVVGGLANSHGLVVVDGTGSIWNSGFLGTIGNAGGGEVMVSNGGAWLSGQVSLGVSAGISGQITVDGIGSSWSNTSGLYVGVGGNGAISVINGAGVQIGGAANVGVGATAVGDINVSGAGSTLTIGGVLRLGDQGDGSLDISAGGVVTADMGVLGDQAGSSGMAAIVGQGSTLAINSDFVVGSDGNGEVVLSAGGVLDVPQISLAQHSGSSGILRIGGGAAPGETNAALVQFGDGDGRVIFDHNATNYDFSAGFNGEGVIEHYAGTTILSGDGSGFAGTTTVYGGALIVNNALGGLTNVLGGGTLRGAGTLGALTIAANGSVAPGNSIGVLNVGDITFSAGSTYTVEINAAGQSDLIAASGTATLNGGTVAVIPFPDFSLDTPYTILTAGDINGQFANVTFAGGSIFLSPELDYGPTSIVLSITAMPFDEFASTPNQSAAAAGAESLGVGSPVYDAIFALADAAEAPAAYDAISGEIHASSLGALVEESRVVRNASLRRARVAGEAGDEASVWADAVTSAGSSDGDGNAAGVDRSTNALLAGFDLPASDLLRVGAAAGFHNTELDSDARASTAEIETYEASVYGAVELNRWRASVGAAYGVHSIDTARTVAFTGFSASAQSQYDASTTQVFGEASYRIAFGGIDVEPFFGAARVSVDADGFTETGDAALSGASASADATFATLGAHVQSGFDLAGAASQLHGSLAWRRSLDGGSPVAQLRFAGGDAFAISGAPTMENAILVDLSIEMRVAASARLAIAYSGQFADEGSDHGASVSYAMSF